MNGRLVKLKIVKLRFRIELISELQHSTVYMTSNWFHATFRAFLFGNANEEYPFTCKQEANPI